VLADVVVLPLTPLALEAETAKLYVVDAVKPVTLILVLVLVADILPGLDTAV